MATRTLFTTVVTELDPKAERWEALYALMDAVRQEFPAYWVGETMMGDHVAAVMIYADDRMLVPAHLNGWGTDKLTLRLVA